MLRRLGNSERPVLESAHPRTLRPIRTPRPPGSPTPSATSRGRITKKNSIGKAIQTKGVPLRKTISATPRATPARKPAASHTAGGREPRRHGATARHGALGPTTNAGSGVSREVGDQLVQLRVGLGLEAMTVTVRVLFAVEPPRYVLTSEDVADSDPIAIGGSKLAVRRAALRVVVAVLGHPRSFAHQPTTLYSSAFDNQGTLKNIHPHITRLAPLLPQLSSALRRRAGEMPEILKVGGSHRERHLATLVSLGVAGPATVSDLARRTDMSTAHASLVIGELARAGLVGRHSTHQSRTSASASSFPLSEALLKPAVNEVERTPRARPWQSFPHGARRGRGGSASSVILADLVACLFNDHAESIQGQDDPPSNR